MKTKLNKFMALVLAAVMLLTLVPTMVMAAASYSVTTKTLADVQRVFEGVAEVSESDGVITIKLTSDISGRMYFNDNDGNFMLDLNGKTIDPGTAYDQSICADHAFTGSLTITGSGVIKKGTVDIMYVSPSHRDAVKIAVQSGFDYFTAKADGNNIFSDERNTAVKKYAADITNNQYYRKNELVITQCNIVLYTVKFNANSGNGTMADQSVEIDVATALAKNVFAKDGYAFTGWNTVADGSGTAYADEMAVTNLAAANGEIILYAQWEELPTYREYNLLNGGIEEAETVLAGIANVEEVTVDGTDYIKITLTSDVYGRISFDNYNEIETNVDNYILDLGGKTIDPGDKNQSICLDNDFGSTVIITGEGTIKKGRDSVVYRNNFSNINDVYSKLIFKAYEGKYFSLKENGENVYGFSDKNIEKRFTDRNLGNADVVLSQGDLGTYTVKFNANGGSGTMTDQVINELDTVQLNANAFTKDGLIFEGWNTEADGSGDYYFDMEEVTDLAMANGEITLYAQWMLSTTPSNPPRYSSGGGMTGPLLGGKNNKDDFESGEIETDKPDEGTGSGIGKKEIILIVDEKVSTVFGKTVENDVAPYIERDRTMLPARFISENLGAEVYWDEAEGKVTIVKGDTTIILYIGKDIALVNGEEVKLDAAACIKEDRTFVPIRFVAESFGEKVEWNDKDRTVTITVIN